MDEIGKCSLLQIKFLLRILESPVKVAYGKDSVEAGAILSLYKKKWIKPFGTVDKKQRWLLVKEFAKEEVDFMKDIIRLS